MTEQETKDYFLQVLINEPTWNVGSWDMFWVKDNHYGIEKTEKGYTLTLLDAESFPIKRGIYFATMGKAFAYILRKNYKLNNN